MAFINATEIQLVHEQIQKITFKRKLHIWNEIQKNKFMRLVFIVKSSSMTENGRTGHKMRTETPSLNL